MTFILMGIKKNSLEEEWLVLLAKHHVILKGENLQKKGDESGNEEEEKGK